MPSTRSELNNYYGGKTHACVGYSDGSGSGCGQIVPPTRSVEFSLQRGELKACVRTDSMEIKCANVKKLYTPNFFLDNWGWFALAAAIAWIYYTQKKKGESFWDWDF